MVGWAERLWQMVTHYGDTVADWLGGGWGESTPGADRCVRFYLLREQHRMPMTFLEQIWEFQVFILKWKETGIQNYSNAVLWDGKWQQGPKLTLTKHQMQEKIGLVTTWLVTFLAIVTSFKSN